MAITLPTPCVLLEEADLRLVAAGLRALQVQMGRQGATGIDVETRVESLLVQVRSAIPASRVAPLRQVVDGTCDTAGPLVSDISQPDACRNLGIHRRTFRRRAADLELKPVSQEPGRANRWSAEDVARIGRNK